MVEATSNALLGVAGMSLDPSLGPIMSPRPVPVLITRCIYNPDQCLPAVNLAAAVLAVLHSVFMVTFEAIHCSQGQRQSLLCLAAYVPSKQWYGGAG